MSNFAGIFVLSNDLMLLGARTSLSGQGKGLNMCSQQYFYHVSLLGLFMNILHIIPFCINWVCIDIQELWTSDVGCSHLGFVTAP